MTERDRPTLARFNIIMKKNTIYIIVLVIAIFIAGFFIHLFIKNYRHLQNSGAFRSTPHTYRQALNERAPITDPHAIEAWMTFDYVNKMFNLPVDFLRTEMGVTSTKYPRLTLYHEAKLQQIPEPIFLERVKNAVLQHATSTPQK